MTPESPQQSRLGGVAFARLAGLTVTVISALGFLVGLFLIQSLSGNAEASVNVTRSALETIGRTVEAVDDVAADTAASISSASGSVEEASSAIDSAVGTLEGVATFLDEDLPDTLESIRMSMPAAIQTANAVDGTLRALSLFGVDYDPEEPFGDSLSRVNTALASLPGELRAQSQALQDLVPSGTSLAEQTDDLSASMTDLEQSLKGFTSLAESYETTLAEAEATIEQTDSSIGSSLWMMRGLLAVAALAGVLVGLVLVSLGRDLEAMEARLVAMAEPYHDVEANAAG
jgi:ABC-type transporter Mla subunit MlaD